MRRKDREVNDYEEIKKILDLCKTASVAMIDDNTPYVVPLSYGYEMRENQLILYFHCAKEGRKIDILNKNKSVCFTIFDEGKPLHTECPCNSGYYYSSIIGFGKVKFIEDTEEKEQALTKMFIQQTGKNVTFTKEQVDTVCVFKIISDDFTGKRKQ